MYKQITGWLAAVTVALFATALPATAQDAGRDYVAIVPAQTTDNPMKIEVVEFFPTVVRTAVIFIRQSASGLPNYRPTSPSGGCRFLSAARSGPASPSCSTRSKRRVTWPGSMVPFSTHCMKKA